jgi:hypothetical protein
MYLMISHIDEMLKETQTELFRAVLNAFKLELKSIYDSLPDETLIALVLDPRYYFYFYYFYFYFYLFQ